MNLYAILFDVAALALVVLCALVYAHKGFVAGLLSFIGTLAAMALAGALAWWLAPAVFDTFLRPGLTDNMAATIAEGGFTNTRDFLQGILGFLPKDFLQTVTDALQANLDFTAPDVAGLAVEQVIRPLVAPLVALVLFFALFVVLRLVLWVLRKATSVINRLPVIGALNGFLGLLMGILVGVLYLLLAVLVVFALNAFKPDWMLTNGWLHGSVALGLFSWFTIFPH